MTELTRRLRYQVAMSLDGYIANENGSYDWIIDDPTIDFGALFAEFDTLIMGRRTFEIVEAAKDPAEGERAAIRRGRRLRQGGIRLLADPSRPRSCAHPRRQW